METWVNANYLAKSIVEEKLHAGHESVVLEHRSFGWVRQLVKGLVSLVF